VESTNAKIRLLTRVAFGFRSPQALIALAMLSVGGLCPPAARAPLGGIGDTASETARWADRVAVHR